MNFKLFLMYLMIPSCVFGEENTLINYSKFFGNNYYFWKSKKSEQLKVQPKNHTFAKSPFVTSWIQVNVILVNQLHDLIEKEKKVPNGKLKSSLPTILTSAVEISTALEKSRRKLPPVKSQHDPFAGFDAQKLKNKLQALSKKSDEVQEPEALNASISTFALQEQVEKRLAKELLRMYTKKTAHKKRKKHIRPSVKN